MSDSAPQTQQPINVPRHVVAFLISLAVIGVAAWQFGLFYDEGLPRVPGKPVFDRTVLNSPEKVYRELMLALLRGNEAEIRDLIVDHPDAAILWEGGAYPKEAAAPLREAYESMEIRRVYAPRADGGRSTQITLESVAIPIGLAPSSEPGGWRIDAGPLIEMRKRFKQ